jgi:hypothetical protein
VRSGVDDGVGVAVGVDGPDGGETHPAKSANPATITRMINICVDPDMQEHRLHQDI